MLLTIEAAALATQDLQSENYIIKRFPNINLLNNFIVSKQEMEHKEHTRSQTVIPTQYVRDGHRPRCSSEPLFQGMIVACLEISFED